MKTNPDTIGALENETWSSSRIKDLTMSKIQSSTDRAEVQRSPRYFTKRFVLAAIVVVILTFSGIALATFVNLDLGKVFNSFFSNPAADHKIDVGHTVSGGGLEVTLLSAFCGSNRAYMMIEVKDIESRRLSDSMAVVSSDIQRLGVYRVVYDDVENKAIVILSIESVPEVREGDVISFEIDAMFSSFVGELEGIDFDFENYDHAAWMMYFQGNRYEHTIVGPWQMSFVVSAEIHPVYITAVPADSQYLAKLEIECSPMATTIIMYSPRSREMGGDVLDPKDVHLHSSDTEAIAAWNRYVAELDSYTYSMMSYVSSFGEPFLTLKDGSIIALESITSSFGEGGGEAMYYGDYFDIGELYSITFCGEVYVFDSAAD